MMRSKHLLGPSLITNESRLLRCLRSPKFHAFVYLNGALLTLLNPSPTIAAAPWTTILAIWAMGSTLFIPIYLGWQWVLLRLWIRPGHIEVPEIIVMSLTLLILTPVFLGFAAVLDVRVTNPTEVVVIFVFALIMLEGTSYVYIRFADRLLFPDVYASPPFADPARCTADVRARHDASAASGRTDHGTGPLRRSCDAQRNPDCPHPLW